jgi:preprotein translocase subunit SecE
MKRMMKRQEAAEEARPRVQARPAAAGSGGTRTPKRPGQQPGAPKKPRTPIRQYTRESAAELKRVDWPTREQVRVYTIVALICVVVLGSVIALFDFGVAQLVLKIFG